MIRETTRYRIVRAIAHNPHIPADREKRAKKIDGYIQDEIDRESNPEAHARTVHDMHEQINNLILENAELKRRKRPLITIG